MRDSRDRLSIGAVMELISYDKYMLLLMDNDTGSMPVYDSESRAGIPEVILDKRVLSFTSYYKVINDKKYAVIEAVIY